MRWDTNAGKTAKVTLLIVLCTDVHSMESGQQGGACNLPVPLARSPQKAIIGYPSPVLQRVS